MAERDQRREVQGLPQAPALTPAAKPIDNYDIRLSQPNQTFEKPDPHNSWMDLARGLGQFEPTLLALQRQAQAKQDSDDEAKGHDLHEQVKAEQGNRVGWKNAITRGLIPPGASPLLVKGYQRADLRNIATDYQAALQQAYLNDDKVRSSNDPAVLQSFVQEFRNKFREDFLTDPEGNAFTPLDLHEVFYPAQDQVDGQLRSTHASYRVQEHERIAEEVASARVNRHLDAFSEAEVKNFRPQHAFDDIAAKINQEFYHGTEGLVPNGMDGRRASKLIVDNIINHAVKMRDPEILQVLEHIKTPGGTMSKTAYAKDQVVIAEEKIAELGRREQQWRWQLEAKKHALSPEEEAVRREEDYTRKLEMQTRSDEQYGREKKNWLKLDVQDMVSHRSNAEVSRVLTAVKMKDMDNPMLHNAMSWLRTENPDTYMKMEQYINTLTKEKKAFVETPESRLFYTQLRYDMSRNPDGFDSSRIFKGVADNMISDEKAGQLFDDWERNRTNMDHEFLKHPEFSRLLDTARQAVKKGADDDFSEGAIKSEEAAMSLRSFAGAWIQDHPGGKQTEFLKDMSGYLKPIMLQANEDYQAEQKAKKEAKENPPAPEAPKRTNIQKFTDAVGITTPPEPPKAPEPTQPAKPKFTPKHVAELMTKEQRTSITDIAEDLRKDKNRKFTERDLRDRLVPIFTDIYTKHGRDVLDALEGVDDMVKALMKSQGKVKEDKFGDTADTTKEGRQILHLPDGSIETEKTMTVTESGINGGRATNIPTIYGGKHVSDQEAIRIITESGGIDPDTGRKLDGYDSIEKAVEAAKKRSAELGKLYAPKKKKPKA
jgi:hypothetical protein